MMIALDPNFRDLLSCFNSNNVRYLILGGYAVNFHGHHPNTKDFDVWIAIDEANAQQVSTALQQFGFSASSVPADLFRKQHQVFAFGREPFHIDILTSPSGVDFEAAYARRVETNVDGVVVPVISLSDLLTNKRASARTRDFADVEALTRTEKELKP